MTDNKDSRSQQSDIKPGHFLEPCLYIILSADLVKSTSLKHVPLPQHGADQETEGSTADIVEGTEDSIEDYCPTWLPSINTFHDEITQIFFGFWKKCQPPTDATFEKGDNPIFWKTRGDEILFKKRLGNFKQASLVIDCWLRTIRKFQLRYSPKLSAKATAWLAGTPFTNTEVAFIRDRDLFEQKLRKDGAWPSFEAESNATVRQHMLLHYFYDRTDQFGQHLEIDMLGPSIDQGFRLSEYSTERLCPISVELAYVLSNKDEELLPWNIKFGGFEMLRGVLKETSYPMLGLDLWSGPEEEEQSDKKTKPDAEIAAPWISSSIIAQARHTLSDAEGSLSARYEPKNNDESFIDFLRSFIWAHKSFLMAPYIYRSDAEAPKDAHHHISSKAQKQSDDYQDQEAELERITKNLRDKAKRRYDIWLAKLRDIEKASSDQPPEKPVEPRKPDEGET